MTVDTPKITFGIIVLNGEPFTRYCLRSIYPFAHEIIVVEGACPSAKQIATDDGHSTDGTLETLRQFKAGEDPENKIRLVTRQGFWSEKDEQSQAYAELATGNYLWQVDIDEFYDPQQMESIIGYLAHNPEASMVCVKQITFWGGFDYVCDGWYLQRGAEIYNRIFRWGNGYHYVSHRPPTVVNESGVDLSTIHKIKLDERSSPAANLYHYSLVFPKQVIEKCKYYQEVDWTDRKKANAWAETVFFGLSKPFRVHNVYQYPSWLERFKGKHPPQIEMLRKDLKSGKLNVEMRGTNDIESLLRSPIYGFRRAILGHWSPVDQKLRSLMTPLLYAFRNPSRIYPALRKKSAHFFKKTS